MLKNLKSQLEKHNNTTLSDKEFDKVLNHLNKGNVFERAKTLRDKFQFVKDNGQSPYIEFINTEHWCQNQFQVTPPIHSIECVACFFCSQIPGSLQHYIASYNPYNLMEFVRLRLQQ